MKKDANNLLFVIDIAGLYGEAPSKLKYRLEALVRLDAGI
jgi:hypothetical protein